MKVVCIWARPFTLWTPGRIYKVDDGIIYDDSQYGTRILKDIRGMEAEFVELLEG